MKKVVKLGTIKLNSSDLPNTFHIEQKLKGSKIHKNKKAYSRKTKHKKREWD